MKRINFNVIAIKAIIEELDNFDYENLEELHIMAKESEKYIIKLLKKEK